MIDSKYLGRAVSLLVFLPVVLIGQRAQENVVPLKNWATPLYWHPNQAEREASAKPVPELKFSANQISADALTFVAITPCRLVDTRGAAAGFLGVTPFNGPGVPAGGGNLTFPVQSSSQTSTTAPAPCGAIPSFAAAYSINLTVVPVAGGAVDNVSLWPSGSTQPFVATLNDPQGIIAQNAAIVPAGTPFGGFSFHSTGPAATDIIIDMNGYYTAPSDASGNTAIGEYTLSSNPTGGSNTAIGYAALEENTTGGSNTATGEGTLTLNTTGSHNTASGQGALFTNTTGSNNTATGFEALLDNSTASDNTAVGAQALELNTTGFYNTAIGQIAMQNNTTGNYNTASGQAALGLNTTGSQNTAAGTAALYSNTTGGNNTSTGFEALEDNTTAVRNTAVGVQALQLNTTGNDNTASGYQALQDNTTGIENAAFGVYALPVNTTGSFNTANGYLAMDANTTGTGNTAIGAAALYTNTAGNDNIAIGLNAAIGVSAGNSNNIDIGSQGVSGDGTAANSGVIRIGTQGNQTSAYIAGIYNTAVGGTNIYVCVDNTGKLGTSGTGCATLSSRRFKEQITDMGDTSSKLLQLRPVTFLYKPEYDDGSHALQYGLVAEEVAKLYPEMVGYDNDGQPSSVKYQSLAPLLLNEVQKQNAQLQKQDLQLQNQDLQARKQAEVLQLQQEENRKLEDRLAALEALLSRQ